MTAAWCFFSSFIALAVSVHGAAGLLSEEKNEAFQASYFSQEWTVEDGLPHNIVNRIVQDPQGYLWMASAAGLARFDGRTFKAISLENKPDEPSANIRDLAVEPSGSLIMLPARGGVIRWSDGAIQPHPASAVIAGKISSRLFVEPNGAIWLDVERGELVRWENGHSETFYRGRGIPAPSGRYSFASDAQHVLWIATGDSLGSYENGKLSWRTERFGSNLLIAPARSGGIWVSSSERLIKLDQTGATEISSAPAWQTLTENSIQELFEDRQGNLWIATRRKGLLCRMENHLRSIPSSSDNITSIVQDPEDNIWIGTHGGGVSRLRAKPFISLDHGEGTGDSVRTSLCEDSLGALWVASRQNTLARYFGGTVTHHRASSSGREPQMYLVCPDKEGLIWVSTSAGLFTLSAEHPLELEPHPSGLKDVRILFCARNGDIWAVHGENGIGYFHNGVFHECPLPEQPERSRLRVLAEGPEGAIWIGSSTRSLLQYHEGQFIERYVSRDLPGGSLNAMMIDAQGTIWLATTRGIILKHGAQFKRIGLDQGLSDELISQILEDDRGRLWCANRRGFSALALEDIYAVAEGRASRVAETTLGKEDGLPKAFALSGLPPIPWKSRKGRLWFATHGGFVGIDPDASLPRQMPPPVYIEEVEVDRHPRSPSLPLRLEPGNPHLLFRFAAINYSSPSKVSFRHQLIGYDADWIETGPDRTATYAHLPPGEYRLRVAAKNHDGRWSESPADLLIALPPQWWQGWGFRIGASLVLAVGFGGVVRYGSQRRLRARLEHLEREHELERERARIARDLHDELGYSVTQIGLIADRLKSDPSAPTLLKEGLGELASCTRKLSGELDGVVWTVSPKNNQWDRLAAYLRQFTLTFFADTAIACTVEGGEAAPATPLAPEIQHHLLAILKESLNNILKHARASRVVVSLAFTDSHFTLLVADNGIGFDPAAEENTERNGLINLHTRALEIGAKVTLVSSPGRGSELRLTVDLRAKPQRLVPSPS